LDYRIRDQFEGKRWLLPARMYARPLELYPDMVLAARDLELEVGLLGYQRTTRVSRPGSYRRRGNTVELRSRRFRFWDGEEASKQLRLTFSGGKLDQLTSGTGGPISLARLDPVLIGRIYPSHNEDRILIRHQEAPPFLIQALIAVEDRKFYRHHGLDPRGIARALWANLKAGHTVQGGSTLTQQLVKNYFLTGERSLTRKLNEAVMALLLEWRYTKEEILESYLNEVYLGQDGNHAIHGFGLAARFYFSRSLEDLTLSELALLVGLVRG
ncbi:MAG: penicillin-binding protein 1B, partial [Gammaproteobacteria bacterium]|nr:penicillin-binding protein 1B [Gammaproteobacteria bacterium]